MKLQNLTRPNYFAKTILMGAMFSQALSGCNPKNSSLSGINARTSTAAGNTIRVGEVSSLSGSEATFGLSTHRGIELAFDEINRNGGILGKKLELVTLDDRSKPEEAATAATKLIANNEVIAVLGEVASSRSIAMAPIAQNSKTPMISHSSTNPRVTEMGNYIFRVCFIDPFQGEVMAKFALEHLKVKKVAILRDVDSDYSTGLADYFTAALKKGGGTIVLDESYTSSDIDFKSQLTAIRAKKPDAILVPGYYTSVGLIARQTRELGIQAPLLGGDGWDSPKLVEIGGKALENSYFSNHYSNEDTAPKIKDFVTQFSKRYTSKPDGMAAMGYDAAMILVDSIRRSKTLSKQDLRDAIAATKGFSAVTGNISLNEQRNAVKPAVVLKIVDGLFRYQTTIQP
jgi:branched-chain amino acid transport system substrate-binding protein